MIEFSKKCEILAELWNDYKSDLKFKDFFDYNDLGLPIAFAIDQKIVERTPIAETYVNETFDLLCEALGGIDNEEEYSSLEDLFTCAEELEEDE